MSRPWQQVTIKDIAVVDWGNTNLTKKAYVAGGPYLGVSAAGCDGRMEHAEHKKYTPVLSAIGAQCGRMFLPQEDFTAIKNTITLTPLEGVTDPFFLYYLLTFVELPQRGAGQPFISKGDIQKFPVPLPPLEDQRRIVAVLNKAFAGLARARANAEANLADARELFEQVFTTALSDAGEGWTTKPLGKMATFRNGLNFSRASKGQTVKVVGVGDFKNNFQIPTDDLSSVRIEGDLSAEDHLECGDLLAVRSNGNRELIGRVMLMGDPEAPVSFSGFTIRIRLNTDELLPEFLCQFMRTATTKKTLTSGGGGANISNLNQKQLAALKVSFPNIALQHEILVKLGDAQDRLETVSAAYTDQLQSLADLRQSLLKKAFSGALL